MTSPRSVSLLRCALALVFLLISPLISAQTALYNPTQTSDIEAIRFVLAQFCYDLDTKNYNALVDVFTPDVVAEVAPSPIVSLSALQQFYNTKLGNATTQHLSSTEYVKFLNATTANVTSYNMAVYLGPGSGLANLQKSSAVFYERYDDTFVKVNDGSWRISFRLLNIFVGHRF
ncbi:MAG: hypothetical protein M1830_002041 [Pleopsidium flavum]|nr:MAG: hypothetical protein M1830_002041 [Pleopsidium flavum]